jgi:DNA-binding transcriptional LysR family regulator
MARKQLVRRVSDVDIRLLRVFHTIVASGGLSAAELTLNIGRSTISRHLADLELRLGIKLCDRGPSGFALTREGERVLEASTELLGAIDTFQAKVNEVHQHLVGRLSIGLFDQTITNPLANVSGAFKLFDEIATDVTLQLSMEATDDIEKGILGGRLQVGIVPIHRSSSSLAYLPLYTEQMYLYCGRGNRLFDAPQQQIRQKDVRSSRYAGLAYHSPNMTVSNQRRLVSHAQANDQEALAVLVLSGRYLGFLPEHFAQPHIDAGEMKKIRPDLYRYQSNFAAIVRKHPKPSRLTETFLNCLKETHEMASTGWRH